MGAEDAQTNYIHAIVKTCLDELYEKKNANALLPFVLQYLFIYIFDSKT